MTATTKAAAKTIFDKAYFGQGQAEAAATKEFGEGWANKVELVRGDDKKYRVVALAYDESPEARQARADDLAARLVAANKPLEAPAALVASMPVEPKVSGAKALVERAQQALHSIEKLAHDVAENLTLAQALAESGETLEELKEGADEPAPKEGGKGSGIKIQKDRAEQNGVTRPSEGGVCSQIWAECDKRSADGTVPAVKSIKEWATAQAIDLTTCTIQYWRKFMGVVGRAKEMPAK